jgi:hypothetical protein
MRPRSASVGVAGQGLVTPAWGPAVAVGGVVADGRRVRG